MNTSPNSSRNRTNNSIGTGQILKTTLGVALLLATIFTAFPPTFLTSDFNERLSLLLTPQPDTNNDLAVDPNLRIGIISGHWGYDSGTVCPNGVTEAEVNLQIATLVQQKLSSKKIYKVDILQEYDQRLNEYQGVLLISIHNDSCIISNEFTTGFKIATNPQGNNPERNQRLLNCIFDRYMKETNLTYHPGSITPDMMDYHAFREIDADTTAVIIETGFMSNPVDYDLLTNHPDAVATGIVNGIMCYLNNEAIEITPEP
ncbi:N-acetylmuramoyl-L-alanine amidase [Chloroflexota bacterium]